MEVNVEAEAGAGAGAGSVPLAGESDLTLPTKGQRPVVVGCTRAFRFAVASANWGGSGLVLCPQRRVRSGEIRDEGSDSAGRECSPWWVACREARMTTGA